MRKQRRVHRFHPLGGLTVLRIPLQEREGRDAFGSGIDRIDGWVAWVNWSDLAGDEGGGMGGGVGRWPMEGGQGGRWGGGGTREQCGSNKRCTGCPFWAPLKT